MRRFDPKKLKREEREVGIDDLPEIEEIGIEEMEKMEPVGGGGGAGGENHPTVSAGMRDETDVLYLRFEGEPKEAVRKRDQKEVAYTEATLLKAHGGWDNDAKKDVNLKRGDKVTINLKRHAILWKYAEHFKPLAGKSFAIANVGTTKTKRGNAVDYRWKPL